jgi:hypothetical protein
MLNGLVARLLLQLLASKVLYVAALSVLLILSELHEQPLN